MAERNLIGYDNDQVSLNGMLGTMAFQDSDRVEVNNINLDTISGSAALSAISEEIASAAVDVFVYDTTKDSDGGAWRKRTQHTSWYNETLNTTIRGSRREFPVVAVIVVTDATCIIYDGDDPSLPMWMEFNSSAGQTMFPQDSGSGTHQSVIALNAKLVTCHGNGANHNGGLVVADFLTDKTLKYRASTAVSYSGYFRGNISERNDAKGWDGGDAQGTIASSICNDIAMTVLPGAPIDSATGLPIPTIAVATEEGASFILDNGFVRDAITDTGNSAYSRTPSIDISPDGYAVFPQDSGNTGVDGKRGLFFIPIPYYDREVDTNSGGTPDKLALYYESAGTSTYPRYSGKATNVIRRNKTQFITDSPTRASGLSILSEEQYYRTQGMVNWITSDYNTGWMHGDIKGAFLSDTDTTNVTGSELVTNGTFATDSDWEKSSHWTISGGSATMPSTSSYLPLYQYNLGLTAGVKYVASIDVTAISGDIKFDTARSNGGGIDAADGVVFSTTGTYSFTFIAESDQDGIGLARQVGSTSSCTVDNISVRIAEEDRSVNDNGLKVFGTITKSAVATGADLVAYSGFSSNNMLVNRASYDFGTTNSISLCIIGWFKLTDLTGYNYIGSVADYDSTPIAGLAINSSADANPGKLYVYDNVTGQTSASGAAAVNDGNWHHAVGVFEGNTRKVYQDGELVHTSSYTSYALDLTAVDYLAVGHAWISSQVQHHHSGSLSLVRFSKSIPSAEQIKKIYEDEKVLFQENAACTLYGTSDAITALAYDDTTESLHVGTSSGRSEFKGLRRINNTTTGVTTAISASNGLVVEQ